MKFRNLLLVISLAVSLFACEKREYRVIDFGDFEMEVPKEWRKISLMGVDSYVGGIITSEGDTLTFDLGWYSYDPQIEDWTLEVNWSYFESFQNGGEEKIIPNDSTFIREFKPRHIYQYDSIDCFKVKFVTPLDTLGDLSGVFVDSIDYGSEVTKLGFYGSNLSDKTQIEFIAALKTISFSKSYCK
tara:strand:+ start:253 stop:810 length:558 start_codon:yes stop_codon:yes gene_type:complete